MRQIFSFLPARLLPFALLPVLFLVGCQTLPQSGPQRAHRELRTRTDAMHAEFLSTANLRNDTYRNEEVLARATATNLKVEIGLREQRGLLLVDDLIALDFPVATGRRAFPTPAGSYTIIEKKREYRSNLYGKVLDAEGTVVNADADSRADVVPEGGSFVGSSMPYWMRLTNTGVGLHIGHVPGGRGASHGCIRLRPKSAHTLFELTRLGTPVVIAQERARLTPAG